MLLTDNDKVFFTPLNGTEMQATFIVDKQQPYIASKQLQQLLLNIAFLQTFLWLSG